MHIDYTTAVEFVQRAAAAVPPGTGYAERVREIQGREMSEDETCANVLIDNEGNAQAACVIGYIAVNFLDVSAAVIYNTGHQYDGYSALIPFMESQYGHTFDPAARNVFGKAQTSQDNGDSWDSLVRL